MDNRNLTLRIKKTVTSEFFYILLVSLFWIKDTIFPFIIQIFKRLPVITIFSSYIFPALTIVLLLLSLQHITSHIRFLDLVKYTVCLLVVAFTAIFLKENAVFLQDRYYKILVIGIPMYFIGLGFSYEKLEKVLYYLSLANLIAIWLYQMFQLTTGRILVSDNMDASYKILPSIMYLIHYVFVKFNAVNLIAVIFSVMLSFLFGTRGPVLIILLMLLFGAFFKLMINKTLLQKVLYLIPCVLLVLVFTNQKILIDVTQQLLEAFSKRGFSIRIFEMILNGEISDGLGREMLSQRILDAIRQKPIYGHGLMGDRVIQGIYAHNIFLEMWCDFGIIIGSALIIALLFTYFSALKKNIHTDSFYFLLSMIIMILVRLCLSGSFVNDQYFYFILGICSCMIRKPCVQKNDIVED